MLSRLIRNGQKIEHAKGIKYITIAIICLFLFLALFNIWKYKYFPSQDGPAHIENALLIWHMNSDTCSLYKEYYKLNNRVEPTWLNHLMLTALMNIFSPSIAEKMHISIYILLTLFGFIYAIKANKEYNIVLLLMLFPFVFNRTLHLGNYSYCYSIGVFFIFIGYWLRTGCPKKLIEYILLGSLSIMLFMLHPVSLTVAYIIICSITIWNVNLENRKTDGRVRIIDLTKAIAHQSISYLIAFFPTLILYLYFLLNHNPDIQRSSKYIMDAFKILISLEALISFTKFEQIVAQITCLVFVFVIACLMVKTPINKIFDKKQGWLLTAVLISFIVILTPEEISGGGVITLRISIFPYIAMLFWFNDRKLPKRCVWIIVLCSAISSVYMLRLHNIQYEKYNEYIVDYVETGKLIPNNSKFLPLYIKIFGTNNDDKYSEGLVSPMLHASSYVSSSRCLVNLHNYEAHLKYFPVVYKNEKMRVPFWPIDNYGIEKAPFSTNLDMLEQAIEDEIEFVLIWGEFDYPSQENIYLKNLLGNKYKLVYVKEQKKIARLYQKINDK
jgi:hypothetical protein